MKRLAPVALLTLQLLLVGATFAAPTAILTRVSGTVTVLRGGQKLLGKNGLGLRTGDKVVVGNGASATLFSLGAPPKTLRTGTAVVGSNGNGKVAPGGVWKTVYSGLQNGLNNSGRKVALTMRPGQVNLLAPISTLLIGPPQKLEWQSNTPSPRYRVVCWRGTTPVFDQQTDRTSISYPQELSQAGIYSWRVNPLRDDGGHWVPDGAPSETRTFEIAPDAEAKRARMNLAAVDRTLAAGPKSEWILARAALLLDGSFSDAALKELEKIPTDSTAIDLRETIWRISGQNWRLARSNVASAEPIGQANPRYLALTPGTALSIEARKTFVDSERHFTLQIPVTSCAIRYHPGNGVNWTDFSATFGDGPRLGLFHVKAAGFPKDKTLLDFVKAVSDQILTAPERKGDKFDFFPGVETVFRGRPALLSPVTNDIRGRHIVGQSLEWREGANLYLFLYSAGTDRLADTLAFRPLLDTLKLGKAVPVAPPMLPSLTVLSQMRAEIRSHRTWLQRENGRLKTSQLRLYALEQTPAPDLAKFESARIKTPPNSLARGAACEIGRRAAAILAAGEVEHGHFTDANRLFARSIALEIEGSKAYTTAFRAGLNSIEAKLAHWSGLCVFQQDAAVYQTLIQGLRDEKAQWLNQWQKAVGDRKERDEAKSDRAARELFEMRRLEWMQSRLAQLDQSRTYPQRIQIAEAFEALGKATRNHADLDGARAYFARALTWRRSVPESFPTRDVYMALQERAKLEADLGDVRLARDFFQQAATDLSRVAPVRERQIAAFATAEDRGYALTLWKAARAENGNGLGAVLKDLGEYSQAEIQLQQAFNALKPAAGPDFSNGALTRLRAAVLNNLHVVRAASGDAPGAARYLTSAMTATRQAGDQSALANLLFSVAAAAYNKGDLKTAAAGADEALRIDASLGREADVIDCLLFQARVVFERRDVATAMRLVLDGLNRASELDQPRKLSLAGRTFASIHIAYAWEWAHSARKIQPSQEKLANLHEVLDEVEAADRKSGSVEDVIATLTVRSTLAALEGKTEAALDLQLAAIARNEHLGAASRSADAFAQTGRSDDMYDRAISLLLQLKRPKQALDLLGRARSQKLWEGLPLATMQSDEPEVRALLTTAKNLEAKLVKTRTSLARAIDSGQRDANLLKNLQKDATRTQNEFNRVTAQIKVKNPRFSEALSPASAQQEQVKQEQVRQSIPEGVLLLQYAVTEKGVTIFAVTKDSLQVISGAATQSDLGIAVRAYRAAINEDLKRLQNEATPLGIDDPTAPLRQATEQLSKWLIEPVRAEIDAATMVVIVPSGDLFYLPFHALGRAGVDGQWHFLIENKPVAVLAGVEAPHTTPLPAPRGDRSNSIMALGDPIGANLPNAKIEVESIAQLVPGSHAFTGLEASKARLLQSLKRDVRVLRVLHLAAHGVLIGDAPGQSYIQLSPSPNDDGKLRVGEIVGLNLSGIDLVTLSACQTALSEGRPDGAEISSLAQSFARAGAPSVIASLWSVEDESTRQLMETFYSALASGASKSEALRQAQVKLIGNPKTRSPVFWAPFELLGDWR